MKFLTKLYMKLWVNVNYKLLFEWDIGGANKFRALNLQDFKVTVIVQLKILYPLHLRNQL